MSDAQRIGLILCGLGMFIFGIAMVFMSAFAMGNRLESKKQVNYQKQLLIEQNKLLKENIELNNKLLKLKEVEK